MLCTYIKFFTYAHHTFLTIRVHTKSIMYEISQKNVKFLGISYVDTILMIRVHMKNTMYEILQNANFLGISYFS